MSQKRTKLLNKIAETLGLPPRDTKAIKEEYKMVSSKRKAILALTYDLLIQKAKNGIKKSEDIK